MLKFAICDDNSSTLTKLSNTITSIFEKNDFDASIILKATSSNQLLSFIKDNSVDVLFLDINLKSGLNGIELAKMIRKNNKDCYIIFITCHSEYVFTAYKIKTFDYIYKPFTYKRIEECIFRLFEDIYNISKNKKFIKLNNNVLLSENDIYFIKKDGMKILYYTSNNNYDTYDSFNNILSFLPSNFVRCHKSFIVNLNNIIKLDLKNNLIFLPQNQKCYIGPKYKNYFIKEVLNNDTNL